MDRIYFKDESKYEGYADTLFIPETEDELVLYVREQSKMEENVTIQGSLTGITGSGVPARGAVIKTGKLNKISIRNEDNNWYAYAQSGVTGEQLEHSVAKETGDSFFFPALPTEKTATLGGIAACGAKGINVRYYGEFKDYVEECRICTADGEIRDITRDMLEYDELFGSEGMLALFLSFKIRLLKKPERIWGILFQFEGDSLAVRFTEQIEKRPQITAIEYMDRNTVEVIGLYKKDMSALASLPDIEGHIQALIYVEIIGSTDDELEAEAGSLLEAGVEVGGDPEKAWAMCGDEGVERLRTYRHAASECVNMEIGKVNARHPGVHKLSLDIQQNLINRNRLLKEYRSCLEKSGIPYCIFGHFGVNGPYVNILARNQAEYNEGELLLEKWVQKAYDQQLQVFSEHGVGKLKRGMFKRNAPDILKNAMIQKKEKWDAKGILNPMNMI